MDLFDLFSFNELHCNIRTMYGKVNSVIFVMVVHFASVYSPSDQIGIKSTISHIIIGSYA